ncbi:PaaX family transcriptional regulator [Corynebacterium glutamicum]|uniref:PaaX family transcriptional regulator n=1 Tax=Corynebacterium glutamicum TaxID=1718 RepID=UPI001B8CA8C5
MPLNPATDEYPVVDLPRPQKGANTQHLLVTMLGEFWRHTNLWLPARPIKHLLADLGVSQTAAATALSRLSARGVLEHSGGGRHSKYRFTPDARARLNVGFEQITHFGNPSRSWDRMWTAIAFTIPETSRDLREVFRSRLRWLGFAPLYGALWVCPHDRMAEVETYCHGFGIEDYLIFRMSEDQRRGRYPGEAWILDEAPERYLKFLETYQPAIVQAEKNGITGKDAFKLRVQIMDTWRAFPWDDPDLPAEMLPKQWPLGPARETFVRLYTQLTPATHDYLITTIQNYCPDAVSGIQLELIET